MFCDGTILDNDIDSIIAYLDDYTTEDGEPSDLSCLSIVGLQEEMSEKMTKLIVLHNDNVPPDQSPWDDLSSYFSNPPRSSLTMSKNGQYGYFLSSNIYDLNHQVTGSGLNFSKDSPCVRALIQNMLQTVVYDHHLNKISNGSEMMFKPAKIE